MVKTTEAVATIVGAGAVSKEKVVPAEAPESHRTLPAKRQLQAGPARQSRPSTNQLPVMLDQAVAAVLG